MENKWKQILDDVLNKDTPNYLILASNRYKVGCSNCPYNKRCYDAFRDNASGCNLYDHREVND